MPRRFTRVIALMFIVQIVLPFTAPLQVVDLCDLFAEQVHRSSSASPSITTLAMSEASAGIPNHGLPHSHIEAVDVEALPLTHHLLTVQFQPHSGQNPSN